MPEGWTMRSWLLMSDFAFGDVSAKFYGFIAQNDEEPTQFVLALRGTEGMVEWWDDAHCLPVPFRYVPDAGKVAEGFDKIYQTLDIVDAPLPAAESAFVQRNPEAQPDAAGTFAQRVSRSLHRHALRRAKIKGVTPKAEQLVVTAHSLGAALATLFAVENDRNGSVNVTTVCTFASPRVGNQEFADAFGRLNLPASWRVYVDQDFVPKIPPSLLGYRHVDDSYGYDCSGKVRCSPVCWHAMATHLSMLDPSIPITADCARQGI